VVARQPRNYPRLRRPFLIAEEAITLVLDAGANRGQWATEVRRGGYQGRILSFEPGAEAFGQLVEASADDPLWTALPLALGSHDATATLRVAANSVSSSLRPPAGRQLAAEPKSRIVDTHEVEVRRLDGLPDVVTPGDRILLKADVEGEELAVLEGATGILDRVRLLELELSAIQLRDGQPLLGEVVHWCEQAGFVLTGFEVSFRDHGNGDLLAGNGFFRRSS
jgi:FkbM family methyltransferase